MSEPQDEPASDGEPPTAAPQSLSMTAMRLMLDHASLQDARAAAAGLDGSAEDRSDLLARLTSAAFAVVRGVAGAVDHDAGARDAPGALAATAAAFDRAAAVSAEGSVALYSLGDPAVLAAATAEVCAWLRAEGLIGPGCRLLEVGCGIGRFLTALAGEVELALGLDISAAMAGEAALRTGKFRNVLAVRSDGHGLDCIADASVDLVLFADSFPYLVQAGHGLPERHLAESARVLRPGGRLVVLNWSYRGDPARDATEAAALGRDAGLRLTGPPATPFRLWDACSLVWATR